MRISKLKKLLNLWEKNDLISSEQNEKISEFMKERQKEQFFRLIKWLFILGGFWLLFGVIATVVQFFDLSFMENIKLFLIKTFLAITEPIFNFLTDIFGMNLPFFLFGFISFIGAGLIFYLLKRLKTDSTVDNLNLTTGQKFILKNNLWLEIMGCLLLSSGFMMFNNTLYPHEIFNSEYIQKVLPFWYFVGTGTFIWMAYKFSKVSYLLFGLYFVGLSVGIFSGYEHACYWIGSSRPMIQLLVGIILILIGYITETKINTEKEEEENIKERFAQTYNWVGLLMGFIALWIMSLWGFDLNHGQSLYHYKVSSAELWMANILFLASALGSMYYGAKCEHKVFFNYGLVFLIIETYTLFCSKLWDKLPFAAASLLLGLLLIGTGKLLVKIYLKKIN